MAPPLVYRPAYMDSCGAMPIDHSATLAQIIQLSVAPVFLLVAIFSFLNVLTQRLARVIDRAREIEMGLAAASSDQQRADGLAELQAQGRRMSFANWAINLSALAALLVALEVAALFLGGIFSLRIAWGEALLFVLAMIAMIGALFSFLFEVSIATGIIRVRTITAPDKAPKAGEPSD